MASRILRNAYAYTPLPEAKTPVRAFVRNFVRTGASAARRGGARREEKLNVKDRKTMKHHKKVKSVKSKKVKTHKKKKVSSKKK